MDCLQADEGCLGADVTSWMNGARQPYFSSWAWGLEREILIVAVAQTAWRSIPFTLDMCLSLAITSPMREAETLAQKAF